MPERKTIVVGGSYPGALSAWFRYLYPDIATASWAASAVVQPWEDMWTYDEQVYISTNDIGAWCSDTIKTLADYTSEQGILRDEGYSNAIDTILEGNESAGMSTADFAAYVGDFPCGFVQYGSAKKYCDSIYPFRDLPAPELFRTLVNIEMQAGNTPNYYDTTPNSKIMDTTIDVDYSGRSWTWQYCTEFGYFQTTSKLHRMRPIQVDN